MGNIYAITSGKGGVGKSTVSVGLATAFSENNKKVLLMDMDEGLRCLDIMLGIDESVVFDLSDALCGKDITDCIYYKDSNPNLHLIPAPHKLGLIDPSAFEELVKKLQDIYDIIILDFPAGIDFSLYTCLPPQTLFLTVAFPDPVTVRDAAIVRQELEDKGAQSKLIINNFDFSLTKRKIFKNIDDIIDKSNLQLLGIIPKAKELSILSVKHNIPNKSRAMKAFKRIAGRLNGETILLPTLKKI